MSGMPESSTTDYLETIEREFHVHFDPSACILLRKRIAAIERGGLGITTSILERCFDAVLPNWLQYKALIRQDIKRESALELFIHQDTLEISHRVIESVMATQR